jgi:hypothetical protein
LNNKLDRHSLEDVSCQISKLYLIGFFLKEDIFSFFPSVAMATSVLHGIKFFEQFLKVATKGPFL